MTDWTSAANSSLSPSQVPHQHHLHTVDRDPEHWPVPAMPFFQNAQRIHLEAALRMLRR